MLPGDDQLMIETCWSDFNCFNLLAPEFDI
jgi:hypothetical protein